MNFDPNGVGNTKAGIFGLPFSYDEAQIVILPVPWDLTVSFLSGTANGPAALFDYSPQIDLFDPKLPEAWKAGIHMLPIDEQWKAKGRKLRKEIEPYITALEDGDELATKRFSSLVEEVNLVCKELCSSVNKWSKQLLADNKLPIVLGGDHSSPLGLIQALGDHCDSFGILQIDAHADLRIAYEGFEFSHASIMHNALQVPSVSHLRQIGLRDICEQEADYAASSSKITAHFDYEIQEHCVGLGKSWLAYIRPIIETLPQKIYLSVDIDGLDPSLCPDTGTAVPGGLSFYQLQSLIEEIVNSGREIIGADLCEVSVGTNYPPEDEQKWINANVGARVLYHLCNWAFKSKQSL